MTRYTEYATTNVGHFPRCDQPAPRFCRRCLSWTCPACCPVGCWVCLAVEAEDAADVECLEGLA